MLRKPFVKLWVPIGLLLALPVLAASPVELQSVQFPEKRDVQLTFHNTPIAPAAGVSAEVYYKQGQAKIELAFEGMKPAILFGGDVTCFVVWAVTRDGQAENLGELLTRKMSGRLDFATGKKSFALMVTAEAFYLAGKPSDLVVFHNRPASPGEAKSSKFAFDSFAPAPEHHMDGIAHIKWDSKVPLELLQARKAFELAGRHDAAEHAVQIYREAELEVKRSNLIALSAPKSRELLDSARRAVALSNEALNISLRRIEAIELERALAQRRQETETLERRAAEAEAAVERAQRMTSKVMAAAESARQEKDLMVSQTVALRNEKSFLEQNMLQLRQEKSDLQMASSRLTQDKTALEIEASRLAEEKAALEAEAERLRMEKQAVELGAARLRKEKLEVETQAARLQAERDEATGRLRSALSHVADTEASARGFVINLPDILFDLNESALKTETQTILAKLAGILLVIQNQDVTVEGHTDSTGSPEYNFDLSQRRASAVMHFLQTQGLSRQRLAAMGYGMDRPVADNVSADGRKRNRRVEIVISEREETVAAN